MVRGDGVGARHQGNVLDPYIWQPALETIPAGLPSKPDDQLQLSAAGSLSPLPNEKVMYPAPRDPPVFL